MEELVINYAITKDLILNQVTEEQIFNYYMSEYGIIVKIDNKHFRNPLRNDNTEGCNFGFAKKSNKLLLFDWAYKTYSCFDFVIDKYKLTFNDALRKINNDIKLISYYSASNTLERKTVSSSQTVNKNKNKQIKIKRKLFTKKELEFWSVEGLNITPMTLQKNKIFSVEAYTIDDNYFKTQRMTFAYHWTNYNYQIYFPNCISENSKLKFLVSSNLIVGDEEFLNDKANHLIITKSKKDAFYLRQFGLNAMFIVREKTIINAFTMAEYKKKYPYIFLLGDNDYTGIKLLKTYRKNYPDVICLFFNKKLYKKDFTDNLKYFGVEKMKELINYIKHKHKIE